MAQIKQQAPQQDRDKAEKQVRDLTTDLAQVKQALLDRDKAEKQVREPTAELTLVKQALQQDRDKTEKQIRDLTTELTQVKQALQQERDRAEKQVRELTTTLAQVQQQAPQQDRDKTEKQVRDLTTDLAQVKQALQQERNKTSTPTSATDKPAAPVPASDKPVMPARDKPARIAVQPTAPEAPANSDAARLMARASLLREQGNIGAARIMLERAAETGSAPALFALAETYDPPSCRPGEPSARKATSPRRGNSMPRRLPAASGGERAIERIASVNEAPAAHVRLKAGTREADTMITIFAARILCVLAVLAAVVLALQPTHADAQGATGAGAARADLRRAAGQDQCLDGRPGCRPDRGRALASGGGDGARRR